MNNKNTLLDIFNTSKNKLNNNLPSFKNNTFIKTYILPYLSHGNIIKGILFLLGIWIISVWFYKYVWERVSDDLKKKLKIIRDKFIKFLLSIFHFVRKVIAPFTILLILFGLYAFKNITLKILQIPFDLFIFILSLINIKNIIKSVIIIIILTIICFFGKAMLNRINIINKEQDIISSLSYNKMDELNNINNIKKDIMKKDFDIKEYGLFIKKNLYDWSDIKNNCDQNKRILQEKINNTTLLIPSKFKDNIDIYNLNNITKNKQEQNRQEKLKEKEKLLEARNEAIQKLRAQTVYKQFDEYKLKKIQDVEIAKQQAKLDKERKQQSELEELQTNIYKERLRNGRMDPEAWRALNKKRFDFTKAQGSGISL
jgi:hypothetical protein